MIDLTEYGFRVEARAPAVEGLTVQRAMKNVAEEVFVGWPGQWKFSESGSATTLASRLKIDEYGHMLINICLSQERYNINIEFQGKRRDDWLCVDVSENHKWMETSLGDTISLKNAAKFRVVLKKACSRSKKRFEQGDDPFVPARALEIVSKWRPE
jgi:hypothetical protein